MTNKHLTADEAFADDDLLDLADAEEYKRDEREKRLVPSGIYTTMPPGEHRTFENEDGKPPVYSYYFKVEGENVEATGFVRAKFSFKKYENDRGKLAWDYRLGTTVIDAYKAATDEMPQRISQLLDYLDNFPVRLKVRRTDPTDEFPEPGNLVTAVYALR